MTSRDFEGKTVLVTGASSGIGRATSLRFAARGASVALAARRVDRLEATAAEARKLGARALCTPCDVCDEASVRGALDAVAREFPDGLDVLVNNAGVGLYGSFEAVSD